MSVKELIEILKTMDQSAQVFVGCQGYCTSYNAEEEMRVQETNGAVFIADYCYYTQTSLRKTVRM